MELIFLGTSSGTPTKTRSLSALALRRHKTKSWLLVDCGEGTQHRLLQAPLSLHWLQAVCITHLHGDHCYGLPGLLASAGLNGRTAPLTIVGPAGLQAWIEQTAAISQLQLNFELRFADVNSLISRPLALEGFDITATALSHRVPSFAYGFTETHLAGRLDTHRLLADGVPAGPLWGKLHRGETVTLNDGRVLAGRDYQLSPPRPRKVVIGGDNDNPGLLAQAVQGADVLVHEATYTLEVANKVGPEPQHSSAAAVAQFAEQAGLPNLVLTHFSPRYRDAGSGLTVASLEREARAHYSGRLWMAEDLAMYRLSREGVLSRSQE
ncbi:beta-lactamase superfamily hydrolase [Oceanimonas sp. GK1]|uniref:ribonuclease Z n=1 Tax=Oceanimonas sp. (strain GK1 / IBRC-M 10197) TaxID=511062 RepID=UPI00024952FA|nr:ribonuclease Z [Oceanimonas sp. GK1]AEY01908.1 beta-lactamase superfamily hydrolase [Oceanimonas sp. GK1]